MRRYVRNPQDFWSGVLFTTFGVLALVLSRDYQLGSAGRMGPGYFPTVLGWILVVLGAFIALRSMKTPGHQVAPILSWALIAIIVAIAAFGVAIVYLGLVPAVFALVAVAALAGQEFRRKETALLATGLAALSVVVFVWGLGLPFRLFGAG